MENNELNLKNFGIFYNKLPNDLLNKLRKECLGFNKKKNFYHEVIKYEKSSKHFWIEENEIELFAFLKDWVNLYFEKYNYLNEFKVLQKDSEVIFTKAWFNIQKKNEFVSLHKHDGLLSYTIWIDIPDIVQKDNINNPEACFELCYSNIIGQNVKHRISLTKKNEGDFIIYPASLFHCAYPFYNNDELRISISGNICYGNEGLL